MLKKHLKLAIRKLQVNQINTQIRIVVVIFGGDNRSYKKDTKWMCKLQESESLNYALR